MDLKDFRSNTVKSYQRLVQLAGASVQVSLRTTMWHPPKDGNRLGERDLLAVIGFQ